MTTLTVPTKYDKHKEIMRKAQAEESSDGRNIAKFLKIDTTDEETYSSCKKNFKLFCETYFPLTFHIEWSPDHLKVISKIEKAVIFGGDFCVAMPRGSGKTTLCEVACLWAMLYGHRKFIVLVGSDENSALSLLDNIKMEIGGNELLERDFPLAVVPVLKLEGIANRCAGQHVNNVRTQITWTGKEIVLPTVAGSRSSGAVIKCAGITGRIRGLKKRRPDGGTSRPDLIIIDDPQTDQSAKSLTQSANRERILKGAILGLGGPQDKIAAIMPCTVIYPGDMADRLLNPEKNPKWNGERTRLLYKFPTNIKLWDQYSEVRDESLRESGNISKATAFYKTNRVKMDKGSEVAWEQRFADDEISALQHAMNKFFDDEVSFWAECQNQPIPLVIGEEDDLTVDDIIGKLNGHKRKEVPQDCSIITTFIDIQKRLLYYVTCAFNTDFTGYVIDYGAYPEQNRKYFAYRDARPTLMGSHKGGLEAVIYKGLEELTTSILSREYLRDDGAKMRVDKCLIDANWNESTNTVYKFCRQSEHAAILLPSHGVGVTASSRPFSDYKKKRGDRIGDNWRLPVVRKTRAIRHVIYDTNYWKTFSHVRFATPMGDRGCYSLWGDKPYVHKLFAEHMTGEYGIKTTGRGRDVKEWALKPSKPDNHWFDGIVGCTVAASMAGVLLPTQDFSRTEKTKKSRLSQKRNNNTKRESSWQSVTQPSRPTPKAQNESRTTKRKLSNIRSKIR